MGLKAAGDYRVLGLIPVRVLYNAADAIGKTTAKIRRQEAVGRRKVRTRTAADPRG